MPQAKKQSKKAILDNLKKNAVPGDYYQKERKVKGEDAKTLRTVMLVATKSKAGGDQETKWKMLKDGVDPADAITSRILFRPTQNEMDNYENHKQLKHIGRNIEDPSSEPVALVQLARRLEGNTYHYYWKRIYTADEEEARKEKKKARGSRAQKLRGQLLSAIAAAAKEASPRRYASLQRQQAIAQAIAEAAMEDDEKAAALAKILAREEGKKERTAAIRKKIAETKKQILESKWSAALDRIKASPESLDEYIEDLPTTSQRPARRSVSRVPAKERQPLKYVPSEPVFTAVPRKVAKTRPAKRTAAKNVKEAEAPKAKKVAAPKAAAAVKKVAAKVKELKEEFEKSPEKAAKKVAAAVKRAAAKIEELEEEIEKSPKKVAKKVATAVKRAAAKIEKLEEELESSAPGAVISPPKHKAVPKKATPAKKVATLKIEEAEGDLTLTLEDKKKPISIEEEGVLKVEYEPKKASPKAAPSKGASPKAAAKKVASERTAAMKARLAAVMAKTK